MKNRRTYIPDLVKMRTLPFMFLLGACSMIAPVPPPSDTLTDVRYTVGGVMSGPYRASVDLRLATASEALGVHGDQRSVFDIPATSSRALSAQELQNVRRLASIVWKNGAVSSKTCRMTIDAVGRFDITDAGITRTFIFPTPCMSAEADGLLKALTCGANPKNYGCERLNP